MTFLGHKTNYEIVIGSSVFSCDGILTSIDILCACINHTIVSCIDSRSQCLDSSVTTENRSNHAVDFFSTANTAFCQAFTKNSALNSNLLHAIRTIVLHFHVYLTLLTCYGIGLGYFRDNSSVGICSGEDQFESEITLIVATQMSPSLAVDTITVDDETAVNSSVGQDNRVSSIFFRRIICKGVSNKETGSFIIIIGVFVLRISRNKGRCGNGIRLIETHSGIAIISQSLIFATDIRREHAICIKVKFC